MVEKERRQDRDGIAHLELLTVQCFTPHKPMMYAACCGLGGCCNTGSLVPQGFLACCLYLMLGGTIMRLIEFHILVLLYGLVTSICGVFISRSYESPVLSDTGEQY